MCDHAFTPPTQIKSVIRRTKETLHVHPMYRDGQQRKKMGPIIVNKNSSQDRLIEELQGKFGIGRSDRRRKQSDEWLTEGVIVTSRPQRSRPDGAGVEVDKVGFGVFSRVATMSVSTLPVCLSVCLLFLRSSSPQSRLSPKGRCSLLSLPPPPAVLPL